VAGEDKPLDGGRTLVSDAALIARARVHYAITIVAGIFVACLGLGLLALMAVPLAHVIAGKHTDLSFTVSISFNAVLAATSALGGTGYVVQSKRARHHKTRARELETRIKRQEED
jgi:hypothetical protein